MLSRHRIWSVVVCVALVILTLSLVSPSAQAMGTTYYVALGGSDANSGTTASHPFATIQRAIDMAQAGDTVQLAAGRYWQNVVSKHHGRSDAPITVRGPTEAIISGHGGAARVIQIFHNYHVLEGFTVDGLWDPSHPDRMTSYRDKLIYLVGNQPRSGPTGNLLRGLTLKNAGGECIRLRYFAQRNEIAHSIFHNCGIYDFRFADGGKNGEGVYIGTAPEQNGKYGVPTADDDSSNHNWIHHNTFDTQGNECVDIKENASGNLVEYNTCTGQKDANSAGFDSRGNANVFRNNTSFGNLGAGVRLGGDTERDGINNEVYNNVIRDNKAGGIKFQRTPQRSVCGNTMTGNNDGNAVGTYGERYAPTLSCGANTPTTATTPTITQTAVPPTTTPTPTTTTPIPPTQTLPPTTEATPTPPGTITPPEPSAPCTAPLQVRGLTRIEAEQMHKTGRFTVVTAPERFGGAAVMVPGAGTKHAGDSALAASIAVSETTELAVWLLGTGPSGSQNSFFVTTGEDERAAEVHLAEQTWKWKRAKNVFVLQPGIHMLWIINREDGASLDAIVLAPHSVEANDGFAAVDTPSCPQVSPAVHLTNAPQVGWNVYAPLVQRS